MKWFTSDQESCCFHSSPFAPADKLEPLNSIQTRPIGLELVGQFLDGLQELVAIVEPVEFDQTADGKDDGDLPEVLGMNYIKPLQQLANRRKSAVSVRIDIALRSVEAFANVAANGSNGANS